MLQPSHSDVVVNPNTPNGTLICNQSFVTAPGSGTVNQPSDDPRTPAPNDPTCDVVGNHPVLYAQKRVALFVDLGSPGIVDPGDVLRYTITVQNSGATPATGVVLKDPVPANTTYVANSTLLNGLPVGQPDGGASPLASGINISSSNLTPPLPGPGAGTISPGTTAVLQYDLRVNPGTPVGTVISNQAVVSSAGQPNLLTDSSGNPANAPQPTVVVVSAAQQVSISKQVSVVGGGPAIPGAQLDYVMNIVNIGAVPAYNVVITDDLNAIATRPARLCEPVCDDERFGGRRQLRRFDDHRQLRRSQRTARARRGRGAQVPRHSQPQPCARHGGHEHRRGRLEQAHPDDERQCLDRRRQAARPAPAVLNGSAWYDANFDNVQDSRERALAGWTVELYRDNQLSQSVQTDANGVYRIIGVEPNDPADTTDTPPSVRTAASARRARARTPRMLGRAASPFTNGLQRISDIIVPSGANLQGLNLPIHPNGVIYNSIDAYTGCRGDTHACWMPAAPRPCRRPASTMPAQQGQITLADGYYKFDINFSDPACPSGGDYLIGVTAPAGTNYVAGYSQIIPPTSSASTAAFSVPACPGSAADAIPGTAQFCEVQPSEFAPAASVQPRSAGTTYYVHLMLDDSQIPGSSQIFNNHIPLDPQVLGLLTVTKTTSVVNVSRGQLVPYTITANNHSRPVAHGCEHRGSLACRIQLHQGLCASRRRADRAIDRGPVAQLERLGHRRHAGAHAETAGRRGCRRQRRANT